MIKILVVEDSEKEMTRVELIAELVAQESIEELEFVFATNFEEAASLLPSCHALLTDLYFPGPNIDKEALVKALKKYPYCSDVKFEEELPFGLLLALKARKENKPVMFVSAGAHHSSASNFLTMICRAYIFKEGLFFEGISPKGYKKWLDAFMTISGHRTFLYWAKTPIDEEDGETFYGKMEGNEADLRYEDEALQKIADQL